MDVFEEREGFYQTSFKIFELCEYKKIDGRINVLSIANTIYYLRKRYSKEYYNSIIFKLANVFKFEDLKFNHIFDAIDLDFNDYEDALQTATALSFDADYIITRNIKDFKKSPIKAITPEEFLSLSI